MQNTTTLNAGVATTTSCTYPGNPREQVLKNILSYSKSLESKKKEGKTISVHNLN